MAGADQGAASRLGRSIAPGAWAVAEQGTYSLANFMLNVLLARWLLEAAYGAFTVAFTLFLLAGTLYAAMITEPMLVFGPGRFRESLPAYSRHLLYAHLLISTGFGLLLLAVAGVLIVGDHGSIGRPLFALGVTTPILLLQWLTRRAVHVLTRPDIGAIGSTVYLVAMAVGLLMLNQRNALDAVSAVWLAAAASALASAVVAYGLRIAVRAREPEPSTDKDGRDLTLKLVLKTHTDYGRWAIGSALLVWLLGNIYYLVLPIWAGLAGTASLRALMNLFLPMLQASIALGALATPIFVRWRSAEDFTRRVMRAAGWLVAVAVLYAGVVVLGSSSLVEWLYSGRYAQHIQYAWLLGLIPAAEAAIAILGGGLRAREEPHLVFYAYVGGSAFAATFGLAAVALFGVSGAAAGWSVSLCFTSLLLLRFIARGQASTTG